MGGPTLVVFDVDGTLTLSNQVDGEVYAREFERTFGIPLPSTRWTEYASGATDQGIAEEACAKLGLERGRIREFKGRFIVQLRNQIARMGLAPVPGARAVLRNLVNRGYAVALATGSWRESAQLKLTCADIDTSGIPLFASDDEPRRDGILRQAIRVPAGRSDPVYVGDGPWDVHAARAVSLRFVGVDAEGTGELRAMGIESVLCDFADVDAVIAALTRARFVSSEPS